MHKFGSGFLLGEAFGLFYDSISIIEIGNYLEFYIKIGNYSGDFNQEKSEKNN
jgi:hypothetical protein